MIIVELIKLLLNSTIELCNSDLFFKPFIIYCISLYLFINYMIYYYTRIVRNPFAVNLILGAVIVGCFAGEIIGLSLAWYKENVYLHSLEDSLNMSDDIPTSTEDSELNVTDSKTLTNEELSKENTKNTIKWFCIIYTVFHIFYAIN